MGGPASEALREDGAKRKSVRKRLPLRGLPPCGSCCAGDAPREPLRQHREATASGSADAKGYREAAAGREAFPGREGTRQHREAAAGRKGARQHREETPSRGEAKMAMGSAQRASAWQLGEECIKERAAVRRRVH